MTEGNHYLIMKRGLYERPNHQGYTGIRDQAGRYSLEEAKHMFRLTEGECRWIHEEQAEEFLPAAWSDLVIKHLLDQRDALRAEIAELRAQKVAASAIPPIFPQQTLRSFRKSLSISHDRWRLLLTVLDRKSSRLCRTSSSVVTNVMFTTFPEKHEGFVI